MTQESFDRTEEFARCVRDPEYDVIVIDAPRRSHKTTVLQKYAQELAEEGKTVLVLTMSPEHTAQWHKVVSVEVEAKQICVWPPVVSTSGDADVILIDEHRYLPYSDFARCILPLLQSTKKTRLVVVGSPDEVGQDKALKIVGETEKLGLRTKHHVIA